MMFAPIPVARVPAPTPLMNFRRLAELRPMFALLGGARRRDTIKPSPRSEVDCHLPQSLPADRVVYTAEDPHKADRIAAAPRTGGQCHRTKSLPIGSPGRRVR